MMMQQDNQDMDTTPGDLPGGGIAPVEATPFEQHNTRQVNSGSCRSGCCGSGASKWVPRILVVALVAFFGFRLAAGRTAAVPEIFDKTVSLQAALDESAQTGKPVFALLTADWCPACQTYKRGALSNNKVAQKLRDQTVTVYIDVDAQEDDIRRLVALGMPVNRGGGISLPTTLILQDGKVVAPLVGAHSASALLAWLEPMID